MAHKARSGQALGSLKTRQSVTIQHSSNTHCLNETAPLRYTSNPWRLFLSDMILFLQQSSTLPNIVWPLTPCNSGSLDELYPSLRNSADIAIHLILSLAQLAFLISIPLCAFFPVPFGLMLLYALGFVVANYVLCLVLLNGWEATLESKVDISHFPGGHENERWIFVNGVAVGQHWLQSNIDRLSLTFGRKVLGIHNPTAGIVFDIFQCLMQRDFTYVTQDIRNGYAVLKESLMNPRYEKVVFIIHSQGGIEGGLIIDWLCAAVSRELMAKLEVYTFGNAANHFNNPISVADDREETEEVNEYAAVPSSAKAIKHIEHYSNDGDFVSRWGVLHFASNATIQGRSNRFAGRVFERHGKGHQFNQHYLGTMFPFEPGTDKLKVADSNDFMNSEVQIAELPPDSPTAENSMRGAGAAETPNTPKEGKNVQLRNLTWPASQSSDSLLSQMTRPSKRKVAHYSRLWQYRNGMSPKD